jgi:putative ABC transport system permease protein
MVDRDTWLEIFHTVLSNPLRTGLTGLSIALGIFILVVMQGLGSGLESGVQQTFGDNAANIMQVRTGNAQLAFRGRKPNRPIELHNADEQMMQEQLDTVPAWSRLVYRWGSTVRYANEQGNYGVRGVDPDQREIGQVNVNAGRFISIRDVEQQRKVAVIGGQVLEDLWPRGTVPEDAVGSLIQIRGIQFAVVGTFNQTGSRWENRSVYVPFSTAQKLFSNSDVVSRVAIGTGDASIDETRESTALLTGWLKDRLVVHPDDAEGVWVDNRNEEAEMFRQIFGGIRLFVWFVGMMTLLAGAMGVANIMAIVVRERTKEIGVRKALGATSGSIVAQIVQEAVFLMLISGCIGLLAGTWLLQGIAPFVDHEFFSNPRVDFRSALLALVVLVVVGVVSAVGPALRAVSIRPVEALRDE